MMSLAVYNSDEELRKKMIEDTPTPEKKVAISLN
jgi:hypothetical protein